jgi:hypothetical protein
MKELTPIEELVPAFRKWTKEWEKYEYSQLENPKPQRIDDFIKPFLEKEKQVIVDSFVQGNREVFYDGTEEVLANAYYNNKYSK